MVCRLACCSQLKESFSLLRGIEVYCSGCQVTSDGGHMMCTCGSSVKVLEVKTLSVERSLEEVYVYVRKTERRWLR